jgi:hypothetical protein
MPETSGTKMGGGTKSPSGGSKSTTSGGGSGAGRGPGGSMAASKASTSRGSSEGSRQGGGGSAGNNSASRGPGGSMAAAKASNNSSGASRNTQAAGPNRGLAGTSNSQTGAAKASTSQASRGIVKDQSRVPQSSAPSRSFAEQNRINSLKDQYTRYGEAYRTIAPPPAAPGAPGTPRVLNPQREVAMFKAPGTGTNWPGQSAVRGQLAGNNQVVGETGAMFKAPGTGTNWPGQANLPQATTSWSKVQPPEPGIADRIISAFTGGGIAPPQDLARNLTDSMQRYRQTANQAVAGDPRFADRQEWARYMNNLPVVNGELSGARVDPRLSLSQYASGPQVMKDQARLPQGTVVPANAAAPAMPRPPSSEALARYRPPAAQAPTEITIPGGGLPVAGQQAARQPTVPSWAQSLYAGENMPYPAGPEGQGETSYAGQAPQPGAVAPSQVAGQPQSIGEAWNRAQYEKDRATDGFQRAIESILSGNISGNTMQGPRDASRGGDNSGWNQLILDEITRILGSPAPATASRPAGVTPNQSQLDLVLNTFL